MIYFSNDSILIKKEWNEIENEEVEEEEREEKEVEREEQKQEGEWDQQILFKKINYWYSILTFK